MVGMEYEKCIEGKTWDLVMYGKIILSRVLVTIDGVWIGVLNY
jgi:hypothetical protein